MKLTQPEAELHIPDGAPVDTALGRTTDLCIAAHQDDIEIMAYAPIAECFGKADRWFTGVVVTDGAGSPRTGVYGVCSDEDMKRIRSAEQKTAADIGRYSAQLQLAFGSRAVKSPGCGELIDELEKIITACSPRALYTHNLADKHDTHVAVALRVISALKRLGKNKRPEKIISMEVWRGLDWLRDEDKAALRTDARPNLAAALLGVFDSQIAGGKRYDAAALGRRLANATFYASHAVDEAGSISFGLDITELIDKDIDSADFIAGYIDRFKDEVLERVAVLS